MVDFLIVGPYLSVCNANMFSLIKNRNICLGYNKVSYFDNNNKSVVCRWFSNMKEDYPPILLLKEYKEGEYSKYDHFAAINIDKLEDIPDCDLVIGVPVSFIDKWDYRQFDIVDARNYRKDGMFNDMKVQLLCGSGGELSAIKGEKKFSRILIKKKIS